MRSQHLNYRPDIDGLRTVAVLAVVIYHFFPSALRGGFVGVDIFFVISGFLISGIILKNLSQGTFSISDFYARRVKRIFPVLILVFAFCLIAAIFELLPADFKQLGKHVLAGTGFVSNIALYQETGYFDKSAEVKPLLHLWSLGIEEQFYLFWPLLLVGLQRLKKQPLGVITAIAAASFTYNIYLTYHFPSAAFYLPFGRFWELALGSALAFIQISFPSSTVCVSEIVGVSEKAARNLISCSGLLLISAGLILTAAHNHFPGYWALLPTVGTVLTIYAGPSAYPNTKILSHTWLVWTGLISYPLYLWHWPFASYLRIMDLDASAHQLLVYKIIILFFCFLLSWISYRWIEIPLRKWRNATRNLALAMCAVAVVGAALFLSNGYPSRYPSVIQQIVNPIDFEFDHYARFGVCHYDNRGLLKPEIKVGNKECVEQKRPSVFLWGDSYAAALYPGLKALQTKRSFGIIQATECGTPPILGINWSNDCRNAEQMNKWNQDVLELIGKTKPDLLLLHSAGTGALRDYIKYLTQLLPVIHAKSANTRVVLIGFVPQWGDWSDGLPLMLYRYWKRFQILPPEYMKFGLSNYEPEDPVLVEQVRRLGVIYLSPYRVLCSEMGCLTRVGPEATDLTAIDQGHLSKAGSEYLIIHLQRELFQTLK